MFWTLHLIGGWLSLDCLLYFFWSFDLFFHVAIFLCLGTPAIYLVRGRALDICQGRATHVLALWHCIWGEGSERENIACLALGQISVTSSTTHKQIGPFCCWFLDGWMCVHSKTLWVSPPNSLVRLGVSPTATSTPIDFFSRGFQALFPPARTLGCMVCLVPQLFILVYPHANVGLPGLPASTSPAQVLQPLPSCMSSPLQLVSNSPTNLDECFFNSLVVRLLCILIFWKFWDFF